MGLEAKFEYIDDLSPIDPNNDPDKLNQADDHLRGIKSATKGSFPSLGQAAVTKTAEEINDLCPKTNPILNGTITGTGVDTDTAMTQNSDTALASQRATKTYVDTWTEGKIAGEVGTYALLRSTTTALIDTGDIVAGTALTYSNAGSGGGTGGGNPTGNWQCMGWIQGGGTADGWNVSLFLRVS